MTISELKESVDMIHTFLEAIGLGHAEVKVRTFHEAGRSGTAIVGMTMSGNKPELIIVSKSSKRKV